MLMGCARLGGRHHQVQRWQGSPLPAGAGVGCVHILDGTGMPSVMHSPTRRRLTCIQDANNVLTPQKQMASPGILSWWQPCSRPSMLAHLVSRSTWTPLTMDSSNSCIPHAKNTGDSSGMSHH